MVWATGLCSARRKPRLHGTQREPLVVGSPQTRHSVDRATHAAPSRCVVFPRQARQRPAQEVTRRRLGQG